MIEIKIENLDPLLDRLQQFPTESAQAMQLGMEASLLALWENVLPYPQPPATSTYIRTGTLGRSLGASMGGGQGGGRPDIYEVRGQGSGMLEGEFGTRLSYAPYVIGENEQARAMAHWWTIGEIAEKAMSKIDEIWEAVADKLAAWLDGKGL